MDDCGAARGVASVAQGEEEGVVRLLGGGAGAGRAMQAWPAKAAQVAAGVEGMASQGGSSAEAKSRQG